jgi:Zn-dependent protease
MDSETLHHVREGVVYLVALVLSICVHEFGHAWVADKLGDRLPRAQGRVTLNPLSHIDPVGTLLMPLIAFVMALSDPGAASRIIGWGKPVEISLHPGQITRRISLRTANAIIAFAGPFMNIAFALVLSVPCVLLLRAGRNELADGVGFVIAMNIGLCFFNLIPLPPLDGGAILARLLPRQLDFVTRALNRYGFIVLFALLMTRALSILMTPAFIVEDRWLGLLGGLAR